MANGKLSVMEGSMAIARAVQACRPDVISAYPITPQTHIIEFLAKMVADGELDTEYIQADSEFSAASILAGSSATGVRSYTASSSQGLLLMTEVIYYLAPHTPASGVHRVQSSGDGTYWAAARPSGYA